MACTAFGLHRILLTIHDPHEEALGAARGVARAARVAQAAWGFGRRARARRGAGLHLQDKERTNSIIIYHIYMVYSIIETYINRM